MLVYSTWSSHTSFQNIHFGEKMSMIVEPKGNAPAKTQPDSTSDAYQPFTV